MHEKAPCINNCPYGLAKPWEDCCARYHAGEEPPTPEALMRSRYVAYAEQRMDYLHNTWHSDTRPARLDTDQETKWRQLQVLQSGSDADQGSVHFCATWQVRDQWGVLEEVSRFVREDGRWLYHSGDVSQRSLSPGRNDPCPCGSGNKYKKCCAAN